MWQVLKYIWGGVLAVIGGGVSINVISEGIKSGTLQIAPQTLTFIQNYWPYGFGFLLVLGALTYWAWRREQQQDVTTALPPPPQPKVTAEQNTSGRDTNVAGKNIQSGGRQTNVESGGGDVQSGGRQAHVEGGSTYIEKQTINQPATTAVQSLHQLPPAPRDFTGRQAELATLKAAVNQRGLALSGLQGMGGIGKTALGLVVAHRIKKRYPDAQFFLDLKGTNPNPMSVSDAMQHVIRAYHPDSKLPDTEDGVRGLYHTVLHDKRALLFLDNAADKEQVEALLPPDTCFTLVQKQSTSLGIRFTSSPASGRGRR